MRSNNDHEEEDDDNGEINERSTSIVASFAMSVDEATTTVVAHDDGR